MRGLLITLEGGEGTGKSTQAALLGQNLRQAGREALATREPGGSPGADEIRALLVRGEAGRWDAIAETLLLYAARRDHLRRTIWPALDRGDVVVCDRFTDSTLVYQGYGRGLGPEIIERVRHIAIGDLRPDLTFVLDIPVEIGLARAMARRGDETRFESFDSEFHARVRQGFLEVAAREPERCTVLDACQPVEVLADLIWARVAARLDGGG